MSCRVLLDSIYYVKRLLHPVRTLLQTLHVFSLASVSVFVVARAIIIIRSSTSSVIIPLGSVAFFRIWVEWLGNGIGIVDS